MALVAGVPVLHLPVAGVDRAGRDRRRPAALEHGSEANAPLARAILGGLTVSVVVTVFLVPAAYLLIHRKDDQAATVGEVQA